MITAEEIAAEFASSDSKAVDLEIMILRLLEAHRGEAVMREREACAKIAEARAAEGESGTWQGQEGLIIAAAIRDRNT